MKERTPSPITLRLREFLRHPSAVDGDAYQAIDRLVRRAARHCADTVTAAPGGPLRRRSKLWARYHLAAVATLRTSQAWHSGDADEVEAWRESGRRALAEIDAVRDGVTP